VQVNKKNKSQNKQTKKTQDKLQKLHLQTTVKDQEAEDISSRHLIFGSLIITLTHYHTHVCAPCQSHYKLGGQRTTNLNLLFSAK